MESKTNFVTTLDFAALPRTVLRKDLPSIIEELLVRETILLGTIPRAAYAHFQNNDKWGLKFLSATEKRHILLDRDMYFDGHTQDMGDLKSKINSITKNPNNIGILIEPHTLLVPNKENKLGKNELYVVFTQVCIDRY